MAQEVYGRLYDHREVSGIGEYGEYAVDPVGGIVFWFKSGEEILDFMVR